MDVNSRDEEQGRVENHNYYTRCGLSLRSVPVHALRSVDRSLRSIPFAGWPYRAGPVQFGTADFQKLDLALPAILISWAALVTMCRHEKNQQPPSLEVVGPYGKSCLFW